MKAFSFLVVLLLIQTTAFAKSEVIGDFGLKHCGEVICIEVKSDEAMRSAFDNIYFFKNSKVNVFDPSDLSVKKKAYLAKTGYYDPTLQRIFLRQVDGTNQELVLNMRNGHVIVF